jgi:hypothetical protein
MATQYTAGLTAGQVLTAATMNSIGAAWETWTPTFSSTGGTLGGGTLRMAKYCRINKICFFQVSFYITSPGTGSGFLKITFPFTAKSHTNYDFSIGTGRENEQTGVTLNCVQQNTTNMYVTTYTNGGVIANAYGITVSGFYEVA